MKIYDGDEQFNGYAFIGPTDKTHCERCPSGRRSALRVGEAVHFVNPETREEFVTGPSCFSNHTRVPYTQLPRITVSRADILGEDVAYEESLKTKPRTDMNRVSMNEERQRRHIAQQNVLLRTIELEDRFHFSLKQGVLRRFLSKALSGNLSMNDIEQIERQVMLDEQRLNRPSLQEAKQLYVVAWQLKRLGNSALDSNSLNWVNRLKRDLVKYNGLTHRQMQTLYGISKRCEIPFDYKELRFPKCDARVAAKSRKPFPEKDYAVQPRLI